MPKDTEPVDVSWDRSAGADANADHGNQLQAVAMNEHYRWKKKLFSEQGRTQLENRPHDWVSRFLKRELEVMIMAEVLIAEMFASD